jgi:hypothetical protein
MGPKPFKGCTETVDTSLGDISGLKIASDKLEMESGKRQGEAKMGQYGFQTPYKLCIFVIYTWWTICGRTKTSMGFREAQR